MDMGTLDVSFSRIVGMALYPLILEGDMEIIVDRAEETDNVGLCLSVFERAVHRIAVLDNAHVITVSQKFPGRVCGRSSCGRLEE
jgi:hypothetical protein